jgi:hypothetical protein
MRRNKILLAVWLPLFWVAATTFGANEVPRAGANLSDCSIVAMATAQTRQDSARDFYAGKHALRHSTRRPGMALDPDGRSLSALVSASAFSVLQQVPDLFSVAEAPADLLCSWQFYLRLAPEPRAPSLVS